MIKKIINISYLNLIIMYKIKINCTHINDLTFNSKKIDKYSTNKIIELFTPTTVDYIDKIILLYKKPASLSYEKNIELLREYKIKNDNKQLIMSICNRELTPQEFCDFDYNYKKLNNYNREKIIKWICEIEITNNKILDFMQKYKIYKCHNRIIKTIEFICNRILTENEFKEFINKMKLSKFESKNNKLNIQFIEIATNEVIYNLLFNSCNKPIPIEYFHKKNMSEYIQHTIYKKK